jgi:predicted TIM-barrel fold metal-dependent hydrolase
MTVIDADAHVNEDLLAWKGLWEQHPNWITAGRSGGRAVADIAGKLYPTQEGPGCGVPVDTATAPAAAAGAADVEVRIRDLDAEGIDVQVLFGGLAIGVTSFDDAGFATDFARAYNDWLLADVCGRHPNRLKGVAIVPLQSTDRAIDELQRAAGIGAVAVMCPPVVGPRNLDDPALLPFFEAAADVNLAVAVHNAPGMNNPLPGADRFDNYAQVHCVSFPVDQMVAFTSLAMGGVLDRVPDLRAVFLEAGIGWVPYFVHRVHEHHEKRGELLPFMKSDPRDLIERGQCYFSFEADEPLLATYVEHLGTDSIVYSSDYPHWDCEFPGTVAAVRANAEGLGDEVVAKILGVNAMRLYNL